RCRLTKASSLLCSFPYLFRDDQRRPPPLARVVDGKVRASFASSRASRAAQEGCKDGKARARRQRREKLQPYNLIILKGGKNSDIRTLEGCKAAILSPSTAFCFLPPSLNDICRPSLLSARGPSPRSH